MTERTVISRKWMSKMALFTIGLAIFGSWGLYDALVHYPRRGARAAEFTEWQYLRVTLDPANSIEVAGRIGIEAPGVVRQELRGRTGLTNVESARLDWLDSLAVVGSLNERHTLYASASGNPATPQERLRELDSKWSRQDGKPVTRPTALQWYDIPSQWLIAIVCYAIAGYLLALVAKVRSKSYAWDAESLRLTLPGNHAIVPGDLAEVDKRQWHKFYVTLKIKPGHSTLGGKGVALDLLRYQPLETWVLAMEATAFPKPESQVPTVAVPTVAQSTIPTVMDEPEEPKA